MHTTGTEHTTRTAVVTGATSGLGRAAALALTQANYRLVVVGRDADRGAEVVAEIRAAGGDAELVVGDLFTVSGARAIAKAILRTSSTIHLLINNAGGAFSSEGRTADGLERTFALNVLAPYVLTELLLGALQAGHGRVVNVVTAVPAGAKTTVEAIAGPDARPGMQSYVRNKLALLTLTIELQRRYGERGVSFASLHPGVIPGTRFGSDSPGLLMKIGPLIAKMIGITSTLDEAAARFVAVGTGPVEQGGFYYEGKLRDAPKKARDPEFANALCSTLDGLMG